MTGFLKSFDRLLGNTKQMEHILRVESENRSCLYMYRTGDAWVSFQRSAFRLHRICPDSTGVAIKTEAYPYPLVAVFIKSRLFRLAAPCAAYQENGIKVRKYEIETDSSGYMEWKACLTSGISFF